MATESTDPHTTTDYCFVSWPHQRECESVIFSFGDLQRCGKGMRENIKTGVWWSGVPWIPWLSQVERKGTPKLSRPRNAIQHNHPSRDTSFLRRDHYLDAGRLGGIHHPYLPFEFPLLGTCGARSRQYTQRTLIEVVH